MKSSFTIEEACSLVTDGTHYTPKDIGSGIAFLTVKDMTEDGLNFSTCSHISEKDYINAKNGNCTPRNGDVLFSKDGTVGKVHVVSSDSNFAVLSSIAILRPKRELMDPHFLGYALRSPNILGEALRRKTGSAIRRIILSDLKKVQIPAVSLEEQIKIVTQLDKVTTTLSVRRKSIKLVDEYFQALFIEMFGDPLTNPNKWPLKSLGSVVPEIGSGWSPVCESRPAQDDEVGVLKLGAVTWCEYDDQENKAFLDKQRFDHTIEVKTRDLLFCRKNTYELVAASAYVFNTRPKLMMSDLIFRLNPGRDSNVNPVFLWKLLVNENQRALIQSLASGSAGSMPNISKERLKKVQLICPPLELQNNFAQKVTEVYALKMNLLKSQKDLHRLFDSLLAESFQAVY